MNFDHLYRLNISLFCLLFLVALFYTYSNIGGSGLFLPYNIAVWGVASWFLPLSAYYVLKQSKLVYTDFIYYLAALVFVIVVLGLRDNVVNPVEWFFRVIFILGGGLFFLSLLQLDLKEKKLGYILSIVVISGLAQSLVGLLQIHNIEWLSLSYQFPDTIPRGTFQQVNVYAIFLATTAVIALYLLARPQFKKRLYFKIILWLSFSAALYIIFSTGSRAGLLTVVTASALLTITCYKQLKIKKVIAIVLLSLLSFGAAQPDIEKTIDKAGKLKEQTYTNARVAMYSIGYELITEKPMGYGIGSFLKVWNRQASDFVERHPETNMPAYLTHPHNELLFWTIEGGIPALVAILLILAIITKSICKCGIQRGGAYAAMLLPITFHTQVELPFYISSLHWFLWLFLVFLVFRHKVKSVRLVINPLRDKAIIFFAILITASTSAFLINTIQAQKDIFNFVKGIKTDTAPLSIAFNNFNTKNYAEQLAMRSMLYYSIDNDNNERVIEFEKWALAYVDKSPELKMYEDLISASVYLNPVGKGCDMINEALTMYAHNKPLQKARDEKCN